MKLRVVPASTASSNDTLSICDMNPKPAETKQKTNVATTPYTHIEVMLRIHPVPKKSSGLHNKKGNNIGPNAAAIKNTTVAYISITNPTNTRITTINFKIKIKTPVIKSVTKRFTPILIIDSP